MLGGQTVNKKSDNYVIFYIFGPTKSGWAISHPGLTQFLHPWYIIRPTWGCGYSCSCTLLNRNFVRRINKHLRRLMQLDVNWSTPIIYIRRVMWHVNVINTPSSGIIPPYLYISINLGLKLKESIHFAPILLSRLLMFGNFWKEHLVSSYLIT